MIGDNSFNWRFVLRLVPSVPVFDEALLRFPLNTPPFECTYFRRSKLFSIQILYYFVTFKKLTIINDKGRTIVFLKRGFFVQSIFFHFFLVFFLFVLNITIALLNYFRNV